MLRFVLFVYACMVLGCGTLQAEIRLDGFVPAGIDVARLQSDYSRIWKTINPGKAANLGAPITISYYVKAEMGANSPLPEWGGGGALGPDRIIVAIDGTPLLNLSLYQITVHELVHCALMRAYPRVRIPRWFHEGVAMTLSGELSATEQQVLSKAIIFNKLFALASIDSVNRFGAFRAEAAYAQSHQAVLFLIETYGIRIVPQVLQAAGGSDNFWAGVDSVVSLTPLEFEVAYKNYLNERYRFVFLLADSYLFWIGIVVLFIIGLVITLRKNKRRREKMAEQEKKELLAIEKEKIKDGGQKDLPEGKEFQDDSELKNPTKGQE